MPYDIVEDHPRCDSGDYGLEKEGEFMGCHSSEESAQDQIAAIEANKSTGEGSTHLVGPHGSEVKDLDDKGTVGGYLVVFGSPTETDLERDFFTKQTDFWLSGGEGKSAALYAHGTDPKLGKRRIDKDWGSLVLKDAGVWMETQIEKRSEYEEAILQLAKEGKLGLSSGTASHLVEREAVEEGKEGVTKITQWPLGLDASLTPQPAEPRTSVQPLKGLTFPTIKDLASLGIGEAPGGDEEALRPEKQPGFRCFPGQHRKDSPTEEEIEKRYEAFQDATNMSASEVEEWAESDCSDLASQNPSEVRERVIGLLRTNKDDWGEEEYRDAGRVVSFISRMRGVQQGDPAEEGCPSERDIALRNWAFDPSKSSKEKSTDMGVLVDLGIANIKASVSNLAEGDYVRWDSAGGVAHGEVVSIGMGETLDPNTTDRTYDTSEDEPGLLIALVDRNEEGDIERRTNDDGEDMTVYHLPQTVEKVEASDVKSSPDFVPDLPGKTYGEFWGDISAKETHTNEISLLEKRRLIESDFNEQFDAPANVMAIYDSFVIVRMRRSGSKKTFRVDYSGSATGGYDFANMSEWAEVVQMNTYRDRTRSLAMDSEEQEEAREAMRDLNNFVNRRLSDANGRGSSDTGSAKSGDSFEDALDSLLSFTE